MSTTEIIGLFLFSTICYCIFEIILGRKIRKQKKFYYSVYQAEVTRSYFASTRNEMMQMVINKEIDCNSEFFKSIYHLNTVIMRNPDKYTQLSAELMDFLMFRDKNSKAERIQLTDKEKKIVRLTSNALGHMIIDYSFWLKILFRFKKNTNKEELSKRGFIASFISCYYEQEKIKAQKAIRSVKEKLDAIAYNSVYSTSDFSIY
jgi:hypothetical protein